MESLRMFLYPLTLYVSILLLSFIISGCTQTQIDRLKTVGKEPAMQQIVNPVEKPEYAPISWPIPSNKFKPAVTAGSLWQDGSRSFFKDQRARTVGDILMVKVQISDKAELDNKTERKRETTQDLDAPSIFGLTGQLVAPLPGDANPVDLIDIVGSNDTSGEGIIEREEVIETQIAAVVTQVLENGNLVISGTQEIRVNFEVRQLTVSGIIRPEDISETNDIELNHIAEARISYGGRGLITDVQQPRVGNQIIDIISPW